MANFKKSDLYYTDYDWKASEGDNSKITGFPDNILLNRKEGYEVLHFLNRYMDSRGWSQIATFNRLERALRNDVPSDKRSHKNIREWLDNNFKL